MARIFGVSSKDYQRYLTRAGVYDGAIDGKEGVKTKNATAIFLNRLPKGHFDALLGTRPKVSADLRFAEYPRERIAVSQAMLFGLGFYEGEIDGRQGPSTVYALEQWQNYLRGIDTAVSSPPSSDEWPTYGHIEEFYGKPGTGHTLLELPYPMLIAWDLSNEVHRIVINKRCAESAKKALNDVLLVYGMDDIRRLKLDLFGGCYNNRNMRGGARKSVHAYAAAIDFAPEQNQLRWGADKALFATKPYDDWWKIWERYGWTSLGRERNYDWMHIQACEV